MLVVDIQIAKQLKTNHEMANIYILKHKLIGRLPNIALNFLPNDRVELVKVLNTRDNGKIIIPSFVTDINELIHTFYNCISIKDTYTLNKWDMNKDCHIFEPFKSCNIPKDSLPEFAGVLISYEYKI